MRRSRKVARSSKVLALTAEAWGGAGGIAQSTRDLLTAFASIEGLGEIHVLPRITREKPQAIPRGVLQYREVGGRLRYAIKALWLTLTQHPKIIYCGHAFMAPLAHLMARLVGARLISHVHGLEVWQPLSWATRRGLAGSDLVLCVSRHTASKVISTMGVDPARCAVIFNTVHERFTPGDRAAARSRFEVRSEALVLSTVSRLDPSQRHKGHDRVIRLLPKLARRVPNIVYLIAGTGGDRDRLAALAETHGVAHLVRFLGYVPAEDLPDFYRATDLYVMPSHGEGFGIAFVEAMACGTPALGLDVGGASDALCDGRLGCAVTVASLPIALEELVTAPAPDCELLAARTREMFGRPRFESRLAAALARLVDGEFAPRKVTDS